MPGVDELLRRRVGELTEEVPPGDFARVARRRRRLRVLRRARAGALAVAVVAGSAGGVLALARAFRVDDSPSRPAAILGSGTLAFVSDVDGDAEIYLLSGEGSPTRLTDNDGDDLAPAWSPDGTRIAFLRQAGQLFHVWVMNADGTEARRLTPSGPGEVVAGEVSGDTMWLSRPSWSSDGSRIAFGGIERGLPCPSEGCPYLDLEIFSLHIDGSDLVNLTDTTTTDEWDPAWAPDEDTIVFVQAARRERGVPPSGPESIAQLYILSSEAPGVGQLTHLPGSGVRPAWSPDGTRIAFEGDGDIHLINADGTGLRRLVKLPPPDDAVNRAPHPAYGNYEPAWSPDGSWIVFTSDRDGTRRLYAMSPKSTEDQAVLLADLEGEQWAPAWQPSPAAMDREDPSPIPAATPPEEKSPAAACINVDAGVPADGGTRGPLVGDVDGDGSDDRVYVQANLDRSEACRYSLVVETAERRHEAPIREPEFGDLGLYLRPLLLGEIDGREGMEIVLEAHRGAARSFLRVFTMTQEGPAVIELQAQAGRPFEYGASGSGIASVDCAPGWGEGLIAVLEAVPEARGTYFVTQRLYLVEGTSFVPEHQEGGNVRYEEITEERFPELGDHPFDDCDPIVGP